MSGRFVVVAGVCLLLAGACSGDDESGGSSGAGSDVDFGNPSAGTSGGMFGPSNVAPGAQGASGACAEGSARTSRVKPRVVLVVDGSCSMSTNYPSSGGPSATVCSGGGGTRWGALREALLGGNGVVTRLEPAVEFGLVIFGTQPQCPLASTPIDPALNNAAAIGAAFPQTPPGLYTPTGAALDWVYNNMFTGTTLDFDQGPQIVILATDGEPNSCGDANTNYQPSIDAANVGALADVTTYVISLAASSGEFHDHLQQLATLGTGPAGGGTLYEPTTPEALAADLELLIGGAVGCDLALNGWVREGGECQGSVTLNGRAIPCNDPNGWELPDERHIRLVGSSCDELMASSDAALDAKFPCSVFTPD
ncbi:MAG: VWA domain-containing protein [Myxococcales bacterium]|nr:VWA domain-containing protein [Myxococcales bacterium]